MLLLISYAAVLAHLSPSFGVIGPGAVSLAPYFILGVLCRRHVPSVTCDSRIAIGAVTAFAIVLTFAKYREYSELGAISTSCWAPEALAWGTMSCLVLYQFLPRISAIAWIGPFTFTIYLYHIFGTVLSRELMERVGIHALAPSLVMGVILGVSLPIGLHALCLRNDLLSRSVLGLRARPRGVAAVTT